jgi:hypothetical protein
MYRIERERIADATSHSTPQKCSRSRSSVRDSSWRSTRTRALGWMAGEPLKAKRITGKLLVFD